MDNTTPVPKLHIFEKAGLGKAPYKFMGVEERRGPLNLPDGSQIGSPGQPMGSCMYCSTGIAYLFWLTSADGKKFFVGSDCIYKSGDAGLRRIVEPIVREHERRIREIRDLSYIGEFEPHRDAYFAAMTGPHPFKAFALNGKTMGDYMRFCWQNSGRTNRAKIARSGLIALGRLVVPPRKPRKVKV